MRSAAAEIRRITRTEPSGERLTSAFAMADVSTSWGPAAGCRTRAQNISLPPRKTLIRIQRPIVNTKSESASGLSSHGASHLAAVEIDTYNEELSDEDGFVGDRASGRAFRAILEATRERVRKLDKDPIGDVGSADISKKQLDRLVAEREAETAGVVLGAIEEFAQGVCDGHPPIFATQSLEGHRAHRRWRGVAKQPDRRTGDRPRLGTFEVNGTRRRAHAYPSPSGRGRADRLHPIGALVDVFRP